MNVQVLKYVKMFLQIFHGHTTEVRLLTQNNNLQRMTSLQFLVELVTLLIMPSAKSYCEIWVKILRQSEENGTSE